MGEELLDLRRVTFRRHTKVALLIRSNCAFRTPASSAASDEALLGIIGNVGGQDRVDVPNETVGTCHVETVPPHMRERFKDVGHTSMKELTLKDRSHLSGRPSRYLLRRKIGEKQHGVLLWLATLILGDVTN
jgi:hypothetical protein